MPPPSTIVLRNGPSMSAMDGPGDPRREPPPPEKCGHGGLPATRMNRVRYFTPSALRCLGASRHDGCVCRGNMTKTRSPTLWLLCAAQATAFGRGVSPYLPLNLEPEMERQIERVLILADKPVMTRPIAAATVLAALPKTCKVDAHLCEQVGRYLARYTHDTALTDLSIEASATSGSDATLPERYGLHNRSVWDASLQGYIQPSDYLLVNLGGVAYYGEENPTGSMLSFGFSKAQLDIGYKPHWFSPMIDSSMLMSSEAPTMPSVSLSNYEALTRLGLQYEFFVARMSREDHIVYGNGYTSGNPRLAGFHLAVEPVSGWSFAVNRLLQYGGGARG